MKVKGETCTEYQKKLFYEANIDTKFNIDTKCNNVDQWIIYLHEQHEIRVSNAGFSNGSWVNVGRPFGCIHKLPFHSDDDTPAVKITVEYKDKIAEEEYWIQNGFVTRDFGPAIKKSTGIEMWKQEGVFFRQDGPAIIGKRNVFDCFPKDTSVENFYHLYCVRGEGVEFTSYYAHQSLNIFEVIGKNIAKKFDLNFFGDKEGCSDKRYNAFVDTELHTVWHNPTLLFLSDYLEEKGDFYLPNKIRNLFKFYEQGMSDKIKAKEIILLK